MPWVEKEQIQQAKEMDLLTYLQLNEPHELRKSKFGRNEFRTATHSSLVISNGRWFWNKGDFGGRSALDFLIKVRGMDFLDAVEMILDSRGAVGLNTHYTSLSALPVKNAEQVPQNVVFKLPDTALLPVNAVSYLQKRGISPEVITHCLSLGILCESRRNQNVIFIGRDENEKERFACQRGIKDDFKADVFGSDKRYSFALAAENSNSRHLIVFESPIDVLSHATMQQRGYLENEPDWASDPHRLSLGGTSDVALIAFLERTPGITDITLCLDADEAGEIAAGKIIEKFASDNRFAHITVKNRPPQDGAKDYNDVLLRTISIERQQKQHNLNRGRHEAAL